MNKTQTQKGITLIALIITIIVMLILVAVTLVITLGDNGIIAKAREAKTKTNTRIEAEKLELGANAGDKINVLVEDGTPWNLNTSGEDDDGEIGDWILIWFDWDEEHLYYHTKNEFTPEGLYSVEVGGYSLASMAEARELDIVYVSDPLDEMFDGVTFTYLDGDYSYLYLEAYDGWKVEVIDATKESYGKIQSKIFGISVTSIMNLFCERSDITVAPTIPASITTFTDAFMRMC